MTIKAVLFDMDGVLIEAKDWHYEALNKALDLFGMPISRFDHLTTFDGLPTQKKLEMLSIEKGLPVELHDFINEMKQIYTVEIIHSRCKPTFVHEYALSKLKSLGYSMAVCSNSIRNSVELMMQKSGLVGYLNLMISNEDVQKSKPNPDMYVKAMQELKVEPCECLIVEDNPNGIKAAQASGGHLLVVKSVLETNFDNIINRINEIDKALKVS
jgi:beta-phosphoglucomutase